MFELTFLGTSAGIPTKYRNVTALAIECVNPYLSGDKQKSKGKRPWVLIDCGEGTQHQLLHTKLSGLDLQAICITHVHGDHCYGLPGLLASLAMAGRSKPLTLIAPKAIAKLLDTLTLTTELYFTYPIEFIATEDILKQANPTHQIIFSSTHQLTIELTALSHRVPSHAYSLSQTVSTIKLDTNKLIQTGVPAGEMWGKLQRGENVQWIDNTEGSLDGSVNNSVNSYQANKSQTLLADDYTQKLEITTKMVVAGDNDNPSLLKTAIEGASVLVHEATYTEAVVEKIARRIDKGDMTVGTVDPMHSSSKSIACFAAAAGLPNLILTHFSARYQPYDDEASTTPNMADIRKEVAEHFKGNFWLAKDFARFMVTDSVQAID